MDTAQQMGVMTTRSGCLRRMEDLFSEVGVFAHGKEYRFGWSFIVCGDIPKEGFSV